DRDRRSRHHAGRARMALGDRTCQGAPRQAGDGDDFVNRSPRQISMAQVGPEGQAKLFEARVLIVGVGGLGCPAAMYLAASGVGRIGLVDPDRVALDNLHRQLLYRESDVGRLKVDAAAGQLHELSPRTVVDSYAEAIDAS